MKNERVKLEAMSILHRKKIRTEKIGLPYNSLPSRKNRRVDRKGGLKDGRTGS